MPTAIQNLATRTNGYGSAECVPGLPAIQCGQWNPLAAVPSRLGSYGAAYRDYIRNKSRKFCCAHASLDRLVELNDTIKMLSMILGEFPSRLDIDL